MSSSRFELDFSGEFKIKSCVHINIYTIASSFLSQINSDSHLKLNKYYIKEFILNSNRKIIDGVHNVVDILVSRHTHTAHHALVFVYI